MLKILLCDDEVEIREVLDLLIKTMIDAETIHADNAQEAIDLYDCEIDLIISDFNMPVATGDKIFEHNQKNHKLPFLLLNGGKVPHIFLKQVRESSNGQVLEKPCSDSELENTILKLVNLPDHQS